MLMTTSSRTILQLFIFIFAITTPQHSTLAGWTQPIRWPWSRPKSTTSIPETFIPNSTLSNEHPDVTKAVITVSPPKLFNTSNKATTSLDNSDIIDMIAGIHKHIVNSQETRETQIDISDENVVSTTIPPSHNDLLDPPETLFRDTTHILDVMSTIQAGTVDPSKTDKTLFDHFINDISRFTDVNFGGLQQPVQQEIVGDDESTSDVPNARNENANLREQDEESLIQVTSNAPHISNEASVMLDSSTKLTEIDAFFDSEYSSDGNIEYEEEKPVIWNTNLQQSPFFPSFQQIELVDHNSHNIVYDNDFMTTGSGGGGSDDIMDDHGHGQNFAVLERKIELIVLDGEHIQRQFETPHYPNGYMTDMHYLWTLISTYEEERIELTFLDIDLHEDDQLALFDGEHSDNSFFRMPLVLPVRDSAISIDSYGNPSPTSWREQRHFSRMQSMTLSLKTSNMYHFGDERRRGLRAMIRALPRGSSCTYHKSVVNVELGPGHKTAYVESPHFGGIGKYFPDMHCFWNITIHPPDVKLKLTFLSEIELNANQDYVILEYMNTTMSYPYSSHVLASFTGSLPKPPYSYISPTNNMQIHLTSMYFHQRSGFYAQITQA